MTRRQLDQIKGFAKEHYDKIEQYHDWHHAFLTVKLARMLAKQFKKVDFNILDAACYLHDIGRINKDDDHPEESARLAEPFLKKIGLTEKEVDAITHAVSVHGRERIHEAKTVEAKLLYDADKLQILSVYGFLRVSFFLVDRRKWDILKSLEFMWDFITDVRKNTLQTDLTKKVVDPEIKKIKKMLEDYKLGYKGNFKV